MVWGMFADTRGVTRGVADVTSAGGGAAATAWPLDRKITGWLGIAFDTFTTLVRRSFLPSAVWTRRMWEVLVGSDMLEGASVGSEVILGGAMEGFLAGAKDEMEPILAEELPPCTTFSVMGLMALFGFGTLLISLVLLGGRRGGTCAPSSSLPLACSRKGTLVFPSPEENGGLQ